MILLWGLKRINTVKLLHHGVTVLSSRNPTLSSSIQRMSSVTRHIPAPKITPKSTKKFQTIDNVSSDYQLVYKSPITRIILWSYRGAYLFALMGAAGAFHLYNKPDLAPATPPPEMESNPMRQDTTETMFLCLALAFMNIGLIAFCRTHVPRIWFNKKTNQYTLQIVGNLPGFPQRVVFQPGAARLKRKKPITAIGRSSHIINGKTYHIIESNFRTPADYEKFLGTVALK